MRAYGFSEYGGIETQAFLDLPTPTPGPGQLLVAVRTAGVNPVDWKFRSGFLRDFAPLELPAVFGQEVSGVVEQLGPEIEGLSVGDEVFGLVATGGYSQYALVLSQTAALKPAEVSYVDAATLAVAAATAYDGIEQLRLGPTDTVLINGAGGGVGIVAAQLAKRSGA